MQAIELIQRKILPTYGVSFGLPYPNYPGGYPTNVLGDHYPAENPYFGALGPNGLNLGLVNVNPLVSLQVKKTEFGEKVVKPLVNLHITPNAKIFDVVGNIFKPKPNVIHNSHYHHHDHFSAIEHNHHHDPHGGPTFTSAGPIHHFPSSGPSYNKYDIEMVSSKPIFEYHSGSQIYNDHSSIPSYEHHHAYHGTPHSYFPLSESDFHYKPSHNIETDASFVPPQSFPSDFDQSVYEGGLYDRSAQVNKSLTFSETEHYRKGKELSDSSADQAHPIPSQAPGAGEGSAYISFPKDRKRRSLDEDSQEERSSVLAETLKLQEVFHI